MQHFDAATAAHLIPAAPLPGKRQGKLSAEISHSEQIMLQKAGDLLLELSLAALHVISIFILLSAYGAMWRAAQNQGHHGWIVALTWAMAIALGMGVIEYSNLWQF
jgi:uncharacterized membrane protein (DUF485 family)